MVTSKFALAIAWTACVACSRSPAPVAPPATGPGVAAVAPAPSDGGASAASTIAATGVLEPCGNGKGAFGDALASDGERVLIGAPFLNSPSSAGPFACVGVVQGDRVVWEATLEPPRDELRWGFMFASSVALSGMSAVIGNPGGDSGDGKVHVFERNANGWALAHSLKSPQPLSHEASTNFGSAVGLHRDAIYVGNALGQGDADETGVVHVFGKTSNGFAHVGDVTSGVADTTEFGSALAVSGDRLGVVADGGVHIFDISAPKTPRRISHLSSADGGSAPAKDAPALAINDGFVALGWPEANEVHIFRERDGRFEHCRTVPAPSGSPNAFGAAVAVRREQLVIGTRGEQYRGAAYVTRPCQQTAPVSRMTPMPGAGSDAFGFVVGSANGVVLVGAPQSRRVHVFTSLR